MLRRVRRTAALALAAVLTASLLVGCNVGSPFDDGGGSAAARARGIVDQVKDAVQEAKERRAAQTGEVDRSAPAADGVLRTDTRTAFDYQEYSRTLEQVLASLEQYWGTVLPREFSTRFTPPSRYVYYRPEEGPGPRCGDEEAPPKNAFYCPAGDFIAWDESGLLIPFYVQAGDFAAAFVLAHEFGHAVQARLRQPERLGVLTELQADCFAGAWSRWVQDQGMLEAGDLDEATLAVFSARDLPGTQFTDPRAHGSGFERTRAFTDGYADGPRRCVPAPADSWLLPTAR